MRRSGRNGKFVARGGQRVGEPAREADHADADTEHTTAANPSWARLVAGWAAGSGERGDRRRNRGSADAAGGSRRAAEARAVVRRGSPAVVRQGPANPGE